MRSPTCRRLTDMKLKRKIVNLAFRGVKCEAEFVCHRRYKMRLVPILGVLVALSIALTAFGFYESSRYSAETGVANGLSTQVSTLTAATSSYSTEVSTLSSASASLQGELVQVQANMTSLVTLRSS